MWEVYEHKKIDKTLAKLPLEILKRYEKWKSVVKYSGPLGLSRIKGFRDEALRGKWNGFRSSRLNKQYRLIYKVVDQDFIIHIIEITAHDYRKK